MFSVHDFHVKTIFTFPIKIKIDNFLLNRLRIIFLG